MAAGLLATNVFPTDLRMTGLLGLSVGSMLVGTVLTAMAVLGLYRLDAVVDRRTQQNGVVKATLLSSVLWLAADDVMHLPVEPAWLLAASALALVLVSCVRAVIHAALTSGLREGRSSRRVVLVGTDDAALDAWRTLGDHPECGFTAVGLIGERSRAAEFGLTLPSLGSSPSQVLSAVRSSSADAVVVSPSAISASAMTAIRRELAGARVPIHVITGVRGVAQARLHGTSIGLDNFTYIEVDVESRLSEALKRTMDLTIGAAVTVLATPLLMVVALLVLFCNGRPVLFRQVRVGRDLRSFTMFKFRTMVPDAERILSDLEGRNERQGPLFKLTDDPRVTRLGRILRASSFDELPQLFNVLRGDMSLVGPRPALPAEVARFDAELRSRHRLRPGITGLWQIRGRDDACFDSYRRFDLFYVENRTFVMDITILLLTVPAVLKRVLCRAGKLVPALPNPASQERMSGDLAPAFEMETA